MANISSIILKVWRGDQRIFYYVWKLTLLSIIVHIYIFNTDDVHRLLLAAAACKRYVLQTLGDEAVPVLGYSVFGQHNHLQLNITYILLI